MKTRVYDLGQLSLALMFCLGLTACNKDDFYEKEFLDNPYKDEVTTGGSDDGSTSGGSTGGSTTAGSTQGGVNGGVTGGTTSGTTNGSTNGGVTSGSTTSGSTTGSTTSGSTTGSTTSGSTTGSTTSGSTTGSTTSGSTTGSTTSGSTTGGVSVSEDFQQAASQTKEIDIVWVIDNSGSMADEQAALGANFSSFIDSFVDKDVDFKMAITTTDPTDSIQGVMVNDSDVLLTSAQAQANENVFKDNFNRMINVGIYGSGLESGLSAADRFMQRYTGAEKLFIRPKAYLAVVIVSDEQDSSNSKTPAQWAESLKAYKSSAGLVKVYSIVDVNLRNNQSGIFKGFSRYDDVSKATAGETSDIYGNWVNVLTDMGDSIINLLDSFALAHTPINGTLQVFIDSVETTDYTYDAGSRSIKFPAGRLPPVGSQIKVTYQK